MSSPTCFPNREMGTDPSDSPCGAIGNGGLSAVLLMVEENVELVEESKSCEHYRVAWGFSRFRSSLQSMKLSLQKLLPKPW